jgi:hypothetical protein
MHLTQFAVPESFPAHRSSSSRSRLQQFRHSIPIPDIFPEGGTKSIAEWRYEFYAHKKMQWRQRQAIPPLRTYSTFGHLG